MGRNGICKLSIVPVRAEPSDKAEITTQLLFGDLYEVIETKEDQKWIKIKILSDQYEGWIDTKQGFDLAEGDYESLRKSKKFRSKGNITIATSKEGKFLLPAGSTFYQKEETSEFFSGYTVEGEVVNNIRGSVDEIIKQAYSYLNTPYLWGGKTHFGIDCSGFIQQVYGIFGYNFPRDAWQQEKIGEQVDIMSIKPADVAFFKNESGKIIHVGITLEKGEIIHASGKVRIDQLDEKGILKKETNQYSHFLACIRRVIN